MDAWVSAALAQRGGGGGGDMRFVGVTAAFPFAQRDCGEAELQGLLEGDAGWLPRRMQW
jgi:hypothetical protein